MNLRLPVYWIRRGRRAGYGLVAILMVVGIGALDRSSAQTAQSRGTILQYDAQGRVIDRVQVRTDGGGNAGGSGGTDEGAEGQDRETFVPGEILAVSTDPGFAGRVRSLGFSTLERNVLGALDMTVYRLRTPGGAPVPQALTAFRSAFPDAAADANTLVFPAGSNPGWDAVATVGWPAQHDACGRGIRIGMIDTPLDVAHEAFRNRQVTHKSFLPEGSKAAPPGHGTAVAALLVGDPASAGYGGLLPEAQLYAGNIFEELKSGQVAGNLNALLKAFDWIVKQDVAVLNLSLETGSNVILDRAVERTLAKGLIVTAAAGNGGAKAEPAFPAAHPQVLSATAVDPDLRAYRYANHGMYIALRHRVSACGRQCRAAVSCKAARPLPCPS